MNPGTGDPRGPGMKGGSANQYGGVAVDDFQIKSTLGDMSFCFSDVPPIFGIPVRADDVLQLQVFSNGAITVVVSYRLLTATQGIVLGQSTFTMQGNRAANFFSQQLAEGVLLSAEVVAGVAFTATNYMFATLGLRRLNQSALNPYVTLAQGYLSQNNPLSFPGSPLQRPTDGAGALTMVVPSTPAAGADVTQTVPTGARWQLLSFRGILTTAVAVANRTVRAAINVGGVFYYATAIGPNQAASLATEYDFAPIGAAPVGAPPSAVQIHYDDDLVLRAGDIFTTNTGNIQAADQWGTLSMFVREWQEAL